VGEFHGSPNNANSYKPALSGLQFGTEWNAQHNINRSHESVHIQTTLEGTMLSSFSPLVSAAQSCHQRYMNRNHRLSIKTSNIDVPLRRPRVLALTVFLLFAFTSQYVFATTIAPAPKFSPAAGTYKSIQSVSIKDTNANAHFYYTLDGTEPTTRSTLYTAPISISTNQIIRAIALVTGLATSATTTAAYIITLPASAPVYMPTAGTYTTTIDVALHTSTAQAVIFYTTDGTVPTSASAIYKAPIALDKNTTLEAIAIAPGGLYSSIRKAIYTIRLPTDVPVITPASGTYRTVQMVSLADTTPDAVIYYTITGKYPTKNSPVYSTPIAATTSTTIQAIAMAPNHSMSTSATGLYKIVTPAPIITPNSGTFDNSISIAISDAAQKSIIYYTTDGSTPTTSSPVYAGPINLAPSKTTTTAINAVALAPNSLLSNNSSASVTVTLPDGVLSRTDVSFTPQRSIPPDFMGLSTDWTQPASLFGQAATGANQPYYQLLKNLTIYNSTPLLYRIEGDNTSAANLQTAVQPLVELAQQVNVNYVLGVDLLHSSLPLAETQALQWANGIPNHLIHAIEIGNEPDLYVATGRRPSTYTFATYQDEFTQWQQGINHVLGGNVASMGPSNANSSSMAATISALGAGSYTPTIVSQHAYLSGPSSGKTLPDDYMLQPINVTKLPNGYAPFATAAHQKGLLFRMSEINSIGGGGVAGISNSFGATLWSIDMMFHYLQNGMDGVNWHSGEYTQYAIAQFRKQPYLGKTQFTLTQVNPLYYGLWAFAQLVGQGSQLLTTKTMTDSNVATWATRDSSATVHVVVINKDTTASGAIQLTIPGYTQGSVRYLTAPSYTSSAGISLGGLTFDGSADGTPVGTSSATNLVPVEGLFTISNLPPATAAIIDFSR
jgi:hypothetical protein